MRCKTHPCEPPGVGVCPSCLRERLLDLLTAQAKEEAFVAAAAAEENRGGRRREMLLPFPRSVSPYVSSRSRRSERLFYSTPQLGPSGLTNRSSNYCQSSSKPRGKFSIVSSIFGKKDGDSSRVSWLSSLLPGRKKKSRLFSVEVPDPIPAAVAARASVEETSRMCSRRDRGMSPVNKMRSKEEDESDLGSGYSSESSSTTRTTTTTTTTTTTAKKLGFQEDRQRRRILLQQRNQSGFMFCLSPLMKPSTNHRNRHGEQNNWDASFPGEIRNSGGRYCSSNPSFCTNRSRKLADFGRYP